MISPDAMGWVWAVAAIVIAFLELAAPGTYLIWIACAAALTAVATFLVQSSFYTQLTIFIVSSLGSCIAGYHVYRRLNKDPDQASGVVNRRDLDIVGAIGIAAEAFANGQGRLRVGDTIWLAESPDDVPAGVPARVISVRGTTLVVRRADSK